MKLQEQVAWNSVWMERWFWELVSIFFFVYIYWIIGDGANIEISEEIGLDQCYLFGLKSDEGIFICLFILFNN
jgi:hypothetical protein